MAGEQSVTRRSDEYRLRNPIKNVVLWQGSSLLPEGLMSIDCREQPDRKCCIMAGEQPVT